MPVRMIRVAHLKTQPKSPKAQKPTILLGCSGESGASWIEKVCTPQLSATTTWPVVEMLKMPMIWCQYKASGSDLQSWHGKMMKSWWKWGKERSQSASQSQRWVWSSESVQATTALQPDMNGVPERGQHSNAQGALWRWNCHSNYLCHFCAWTPRSDKLWQVDSWVPPTDQVLAPWPARQAPRSPNSWSVAALPSPDTKLAITENWMLFKWTHLSTWLTYHCCWSLSQCSLLSNVKIF